MKKRLKKEDFVEGIYIPPSLRGPGKRDALLEYVEEQNRYKKSNADINNTKQR